MSAAITVPRLSNAARGWRNRDWAGGLVDLASTYGQSSRVDATCCAWRQAEHPDPACGTCRGTSKGECTAGADRRSQRSAGGANTKSDPLKEQAKLLSAEIARADQQAAEVKTRTDQVDAAVARDRSAADVLQDRIDGLHHHLRARPRFARPSRAAQQAAAKFRQAGIERNSTIPVTRLRRRAGLNEVLRSIGR